MAVISRNKNNRGEKPKPKKKYGSSKKAWRPAFISALSYLGIVEHACAAAKISCSTAFKERRKDEEFSRQWAQALLDSSATLEDEARRRAINGEKRLKFHQGELIKIPMVDDKGNPVLDAAGNPIMVPYVEYVKSDKLLVVLLNANNPDKFKYRVEVKQNDGEIPQGAVNIIERLRAASRN